MSERSGELLQSIVDVARATFGARAASVLLLDRERGELVFAAVSGEGQEHLAGRRLPADGGIAGWVLASRQPLVVEDVAQDPRFSRGAAEATGYVPKGLMSAPMLAGERVLGVMQVLDRPQRTEFSLVESNLLALFAHQGALAVEVAGAAVARPAALRDLTEAIDGLEGRRRKAALRLVEALAELLED